MTTAAVGAPGSPRRYLHSLWLLSGRDLKVRYSTSALGYLWSVLDPLVMSGIYWFVFTQVFQRPAGQSPYIVFLVTALLPWVWFNAAVTDFTVDVPGKFILVDHALSRMEKGLKGVLQVAGEQRAEIFRPHQEEDPAKVAASGH